MLNGAGVKMYYSFASLAWSPGVHTKSHLVSLHRFVASATTTKKFSSFLSWKELHMYCCAMYDRLSIYTHMETVPAEFNGSASIVRIHHSFYYNVSVDFYLHRLSLVFTHTCTASTSFSHSLTCYLLYTQHTPFDFFSHNLNYSAQLQDIHMNKKCKQAQWFFWIPKQIVHEHWHFIRRFNTFPYTDEFYLIFFSSSDLHLTVLLFYATDMFVSFSFRRVPF